MKRAVVWVPLALFVIFVVVVGLMLFEPPRPDIRSQLVGKSLPAFALPAGMNGKPGLSSRDFAQGKPRLLNLFASWCIPCAVESPQLMRLEQAGVPIDAIAIRDRPADIQAFLQRWGDPYQRIGSDRNSEVQLALGSSGVPESFVIDGKGVIRYQHIGDIRADMSRDPAPPRGRMMRLCRFTPSPRRERAGVRGLDVVSWLKVREPVSDYRIAAARRFSPILRRDSPGPRCSRKSITMYSYASIARVVLDRLHRL